MISTSQPTASEKNSTPKESTRKAWPILIVAFALTAGFLFVVLPKLGKAVGPEYSLSFVDGYDLIADNLVQGRGYRFQSNASLTMLREPGYPLLLAGAFELGGYNINTVKVVNWLLSIGIACLLLRLTSILTKSWTISIVATLLFLFYPSVLVAEARGGVEILFIFVVLVFLLLLHRAVETGSAWRFVLAGLALGVVVQVRSTPLVFPGFLFLYLMFFATERLKAIRNVAVLVLAMMVVMIPWLIRNYRLVGHIVPTATVQGVALQEGQYTCQNLTFENNFSDVQRQAGRARAATATRLGLPFDGAYYYQVFFDPHDEWGFNKALFQTAKTAYAENPALLVRCSGRNVFNFWFLGKNWRATRLNMLVQLPLLALAVGGIYALWKSKQLGAMGIVLTFMLCIFSVHLPTIAHARHSVPLVPFLAIFASVCAVSVWRRFKRHSGVAVSVA